MPNVELSLGELGSVRRGLMMYRNAIGDSLSWALAERSDDADHIEGVRELGRAVEALIVKVQAAENAR